MPAPRRRRRPAGGAGLRRRLTPLEERASGAATANRSCAHRLVLGCLDDVDRGGAGGHDRITVLGRVAARIDNGGAAAGERGCERLLEVVLALDGEAGAAVRLRELGVVGHLMRQVRL